MNTKGTSILIELKRSPQNDLVVLTVILVVLEGMLMTLIGLVSLHV